MSADRELLELAAKAAGIAFVPEHSMPHPTSGAWWGLWIKYDREPSEYDRRYWNPVTDDGDALRLAVHLEIGAMVSANFVYVKKYYSDLPIFRLPIDGDKYAATRRAIVRAAAEIGRATP